MIIRSRTSRVFTLPVLMRKHGSFSSQSSHCLPVLQRWWKHLELQQFHFLAGGFNIQPPSLNNKPETVSTSEANLIEKHAALTAILLHHADILPRLEAVNVIHSVLLRSSSTVCWWEGRRWGGGDLCVSSHTHSSQCHPIACVSGLTVRFTRCERSPNFQGS